MVGFWVTVALNIPDFTRFIGVAVTSASVVLFGEAIWDPVALLGRFHQPLIALVALVALLLATLKRPRLRRRWYFSNLRPSLISFRTGGLITGFLGILMMPWKLMATYSSYIFGWLVGYSALLGPIAGIMICDYFVVRNRENICRYRCGDKDRDEAATDNPKSWVATPSSSVRISATPPTSAFLATPTAPAR
jgi:nucleobase:cation symporter-1, NCS1 family